MTVDEIRKRWDGPYPGKHTGRRDMRFLLAEYDRLHSHLHHFYKYHAAKEDADRYGVILGQEEWYLGTECCDCEFSRSQRRAVEEYKSEHEEETLGGV